MKFVRHTCLLALCAVFAACPLAAAQDQQPSMPGMNMPREPQTLPDQLKEYAHFSSGTAWQPVNAPENMRMWKRGDWDLMLHGNLFVTSNNQGGPRGAGKLEAMSWLMAMEQKRVGRGVLLFRQMLSADALTVPHPGFPELFQTGETYHGLPLTDHQHPHDVFGELSALYEVPVSERVTWFAYGGPAAEPALGPVTFVHRSSAAELPLAPLGHHEQDSTHISYGVVTSGVAFLTPRAGALKFEGSAFNGREPDEDRYDIDLHPLDSYAVRVSAGPTPQWSLQYSAGHLVHPEAQQPGDIFRQTASVAYSRLLDDGHWCTTAAWGRNHKEFEGKSQNSYLLESVVNFARLNYLTTRLELVDKDELFRKRTDHVPLPPARIGAYTFGGVRDFVHNTKWNIGLGANLTAYSKPAWLDQYYGKHPVSWEIFLRIRPAQMSHM